ncbi:MAG: molecular chaperone TorD family protein [Haloferacaceae archaeon]
MSDVSTGTAADTEADPDGGDADEESAQPADLPDDMAATARARAAVYGLLAATFDGDVETAATALEDGTFADLASALPVDIETEPLERHDLDSEALAVAYDNLFVVPGPHYVPPFASAHNDDPSESFESDSPYHEAGAAGELLGDPAATAARLYEATDFDPDRGDGIPDHLAALFEFIRALCEREAALVGGDEDTELATVREAQRETIALLGWLDEFDEAVAEADSVEGVFAALARTARTFTAWDAREGVHAE